MQSEKNGTVAKMNKKRNEKKRKPGNDNEDA